MRASAKISQDRSKSTSNITATTTNSEPQTFLSNLRSSLSYNKKHKFTFKNNNNKDNESPDTTNKNKKRPSISSPDNSLETTSTADDDTESVANNLDQEDETYGYSVTPVPCSSLIGKVL